MEETRARERTPLGQHRTSIPPPYEAGLRKMLCQELSKEGFCRSSSLAPDSTLSLFGVPMAHDRSVSMRWTTPPPRHGNVSLGRSSTRTSAMAYFRASRFRAGRFGGDACRCRLSAELARVFHLARRCTISDTKRHRQYSGLHVVNPELGGGVRLHGTSPGILRRDKGIRNGADRTA